MTCPGWATKTSKLSFLGAVLLHFLVTSDVGIPLTVVSILLGMAIRLMLARVAESSELLITKKVRLIINFSFPITNIEELVTNSVN